MEYPPPPPPDCFLFGLMIKTQTFQPQQLMHWFCKCYCSRFLRLFIHPFVCLRICPLTRSSVHPSIHPSIHSFIHLFCIYSSGPRAGPQHLPLGQSCSKDSLLCQTHPQCDGYHQHCARGKRRYGDAFSQAQSLRGYDWALKPIPSAFAVLIQAQLPIDSRWYFFMNHVRLWTEKHEIIVAGFIAQHRSGLARRIWRRFLWSAEIRIWRHFLWSAFIAMDV